MLQPPPALTDADIAPVQSPNARRKRPSLQSFGRYSPQPADNSPVTGIISSSRALQGMLGEQFNGMITPSLETSIRARNLGQFPRLPSSPSIPIPSLRKRSRDDDALSRPAPMTPTGLITPLSPRKRVKVTDTPDPFAALDSSLPSDTRSLPVLLKSNRFQRTRSDTSDSPHVSPMAWSNAVDSDPMVYEDEVGSPLVAMRLDEIGCWPSSDHHLVDGERNVVEIRHGPDIAMPNILTMG